MTVQVSVYLITSPNPQHKDFFSRIPVHLIPGSTVSTMFEFACTLMIGGQLGGVQEVFEHSGMQL